MDFLDAVLIVLVIGSAAHGLRVGAAVQITTIVGTLAGVALGSFLVVEIDPHISGSTAKLFLAIGLLVVSASFVGGLGRQLGVRVWRAIRHIHFGLVDAIIGAMIAVAGTGVVLWLFASVLVDAPSTLIAREIENSAVLRGIDTVMPPVPDAFARLDAYLVDNGFPEVLVGLVPGPTSSVRVATSPQVQEASQAAGASTVKVVAYGCGEELEGSGFAVSDDLVVTNAHVIAGTTSIGVFASDGHSSRAVPVLFDPHFDLAVLRVTPLGVPALSFDDNVVGRGTQVVFLGYPEGGPLTVRPAGVIDQFTAEGRDIYDESLTVRPVYELHAEVQPGNSGGPLVTPGGQVLGVVFSRSTTESDVGFALTASGVQSRVAEAEQHPVSAGTGSCVG